MQQADVIQLRGIKVLGRHGVFEFEKQIPQPFEVDVDLEVDISKAGETDSLEDTVSYVETIGQIKRIIENENYELIERLASRLAAEILKEPRISAVELTLRKLHPAVEADIRSSGVRIRRTQA